MEMSVVERRKVEEYKTTKFCSKQLRVWSKLHEFLRNADSNAV